MSVRQPCCAKRFAGEPSTIPQEDALATCDRGLRLRSRAKPLLRARRSTDTARPAYRSQLASPPPAAPQPPEGGLSHGHILCNRAEPGERDDHIDHQDMHKSLNAAAESPRWHHSDRLPALATARHLPPLRCRRHSDSEVPGQRARLRPIRSTHGAELCSSVICRPAAYIQRRAHWRSLRLEAQSGQQMRQEAVQENPRDSR